MVNSAELVGKSAVYRSKEAGAVEIYEVEWDGIDREELGFYQARSNAGNSIVVSCDPNCHRMIGSQKKFSRS